MGAGSSSCARIPGHSSTGAVTFCHNGMHRSTALRRGCLSRCWASGRVDGAALQVQAWRHGQPWKAEATAAPAATAHLGSVGVPIRVCFGAALPQSTHENCCTRQLRCLSALVMTMGPSPSRAWQPMDRVCGELAAVSGIYPRCQIDYCSPRRYLTLIILRGVVGHEWRVPDHFRAGRERRGARSASGHHGPSVPKSLIIMVFSCDDAWFLY